MDKQFPYLLYIVYALDSHPFKIYKYIYSEIYLRLSFFSPLSIFDDSLNIWTALHILEQLAEARFDNSLNCSENL